MTNLDIPLDDIIQPVRKYKPNDPYYYEVDNLPIEELESNCVTLNTNIRTIRDTVVAEYPSESTVRALIGAAQYETQNTWAFGTYQMYLEGNLFDPDLTFNTGKVYQQQQIWDESVGYSTGPLFSRFMGKYIDRAGHQGGTGVGQILNEGGVAWTWTAGHILDWFYDKNYITTTFSDIVKLSSKDVNAITRDDSNSVYDAADPDISNPFMTKADLNTYVKPDSADAANAATTANSANPFATMGDVPPRVPIGSLLFLDKVNWPDTTTNTSTANRKITQDIDLVPMLTGGAGTYVVKFRWSYGQACNSHFGNNDSWGTVKFGVTDGVMDSFLPDGNATGSAYANYYSFQVRCSRAYNQHNHAGIIGVKDYGGGTTIISGYGNFLGYTGGEFGYSQGTTTVPPGPGGSMFALDRQMISFKWDGVTAARFMMSMPNRDYSDTIWVPVGSCQVYLVAGS